MNRSTMHTWALVAAAGLGLSADAAAQAVPPLLDWEFICDDPSTTQSNFSNDYAIIRHRNDLFGYTVGVDGTVTFEQCFGNPGFTANVAGRIGFQIGRVGSIQDVLIEGQPIDDDMMLQLGMPYGIGANWGYPVLVKEDDTGGRTFTPWGDDDQIDSYFIGASDRYGLMIDDVDDVEMTLRTDLIGDATRLQWTLTNLDGDPTRVGLWFGQWVVATTPMAPGTMTPIQNVRVPGLRPLTTAHRFSRNPNPGASPIERQMPPYVDFGLTQSLAYGLQVITQPTEGATSALNDQTPCDGLDVGDAGIFISPNLLGTQLPGANNRPMSEAWSILFDDVTFLPTNSPLSGAGYIQKWNPIAVGGSTTGNASRTIVAYYKSTTGNSDYARPYSAVVDAPRTIGVLDSNPNQFNPNLSTIRVYIDNTRGFSTVNKAVPLTDVRITLDLPQGITDAADASNSKTRIVKFIDRVEPNDASFIDPALPLAFVDFQVRVAPEVFGPQNYTVTVEPQPGTTKVINGTINIATTPRLLIRDQANLVTAPWQFVNTTWGAILGGGTTPLQPDVDYQAFAWDAQRQEYVLQTGPQRGRGTWIISARDVGYKQLDGTPRTPQDLAEGAPPVLLRSGWNLIANPYNYPIELGQIVGVSDTNPTGSLTFEELASQDIVSSSLAWWDQATQSYKFTVGFSDQLLPNRGYWIFVNTVQDVTLFFPPVFLPFIPRGSGGIEQASGWKLNLTARTAKGMDDQNFIGTAATASQVKANQVMEPPMAPVKGAVSAALVEGDRRLAQLLRQKSNRMEWRYSVTPRENGTVTVNWPNVNQVPSNVRLRIYDDLYGTSYDLRQMPSLSFFGKAGRTQQYRIVAEDVAAAPVLGSFSASSTTAYATLRYGLNTGATTSVRILQNGRLVATVTANRSESAGSKTLSWNLRDAANRRVRRGTYVAEIRAVTGSKTESKTVSFLVR